MINWYQKCRKKIEQIYGDDADLFCDLLAATSPRRQVKANWKLAVEIFDLYKDVGTSMCGYLIQTNKSWITGILPCHKNNIHAALFNEELSGRKVRAFAANLKGDMSKITIDVWIGRYFGFDKITDKVYSQIESMIRMMAATCDLKPAELQAKLWCDVILEYGKTSRSFLAAVDNQMCFEFGG